MNTKLPIAALLAGLVYFLLGWGIYGVALKDVLAMPAGMKEIIEYPEAEFKMSLMLLSCFAWGLLIAYLLSKMGINNWQSGAITAAIIGALVSLSIGSGQASMFKFASMNNTFIDMVANAFCTGITGAVAAWWLGRK